MTCTSVVFATSQEESATWFQQLWWAYMPVSYPSPEPQDTTIITTGSQSAQSSQVISTGELNTWFDIPMLTITAIGETSLTSSQETIKTDKPICHFTDEDYTSIYFVDIYRSPFQNEIKTLVKYCIVRGRWDMYQYFNPWHNITNEEFIKILTKSLVMSDWVKKSDRWDSNRSDKYYDKALEIELFSHIPTKRARSYWVTRIQAYNLIIAGLQFTQQQGNIWSYRSYYTDISTNKRYLTRGQASKMIVDIVGLK